MALEDDRTIDLPVVRPDPAHEQPIQKLKKKFFYFQPVEGNMAYHSLQGEHPVRFDFMAKPVSIVDAEFNDDGSPSSITTTLSMAAPFTCMLSNMKFEDLAGRLYVWYDSESGYRTDADVYLDRS